MDIARYEILREQKPEATRLQSQKDIAAGLYRQESAEEHLKRLRTELNDELSPDLHPKPRGTRKAFSEKASGSAGPVRQNPGAAGTRPISSVIVTACAARPSFQPALRLHQSPIPNRSRVGYPRAGDHFSRYWWSRRGVLSGCAILMTPLYSL